MDTTSNYGEKYVAPFAGAWIEMQVSRITRRLLCVAPFAGAWIEIKPMYLSISILKVAPFAGAWIEMTLRPLLRYP